MGKWKELVEGTFCLWVKCGGILCCFSVFLSFSIFTGHLRSAREYTVQSWALCLEGESIPVLKSTQPLLEEWVRKTQENRKGRTQVSIAMYWVVVWYKGDKRVRPTKEAWGEPWRRWHISAESWGTLVSGGRTSSGNRPVSTEAQWGKWELQAIQYGRHEEFQAGHSNVKSW